MKRSSRQIAGQRTLQFPEPAPVPPEPKPFMAITAINRLHQLTAPFRRVATSRLTIQHRLNIERISELCDLLAKSRMNEVEIDAICGPLEKLIQDVNERTVKALLTKTRLAIYREKGV